MSIDEINCSEVDTQYEKFDHYNILLAPSSELFKQALVVMMSAICNCKLPCHFYIMQTDWPNDLKKEGEAFISAYPGNTISFIQMNDETFKGLTPWKGRYGTYYKLIAHLYLPEFVDRILYLDCDLYVNKDIYEYYSMDFNDSYFIASTETLSLDYYKTMEKNGVEKHGIVNCGVVLFDIKRFREDGITMQTYKDAIAKINENYFMDQGLMSYIFKDRMIELPSYKYNHLLFQEGTENQSLTYKKIFSTSMEERKNLFVKPYWDEAYDEEQDATIIHFAGVNVVKPWQSRIKMHDNKIEMADIPFIEKTHLSHDVADKFYICWWKIAAMLPKPYFESLLLESQDFNNSILRNKLNKLNDQLNMTEKALNFCVDLFCDNFDEKRLKRYIKSLSCKNIVVLKNQDRAAKVFKAAADACQVKIIFSSDKNSLFQLNDEEFNKCKDADVVITCCVHGTKTHERDGVKCIDIMDILYDNSVTESLPHFNDIDLPNFSEKVLKELEKLSASISEQNHSLSTQLSESHINENEIKAGQFEIKNLYNKITVSTEERKKLEEQIDYLNGSLDISKKQTDAFSQERSSLYKTIGQMESMIERYETDIQSLLQKNDSLEAELKKAQIDLQTDSKHIRTLETECESLKAQISEMENSRSWRYTRIFRKNKKDEEI